MSEETGSSGGAGAPAELVHLERREDGVAVITLDNPKVNALSSVVLSQLRAAADDLHADPPGAVVITGGDRIFAAGADISEFHGPVDAARLGGLFIEAFDAIAQIPRLVLAAINGFALGGGCELALACDLRFASHRAKFGQPEVFLGIIPGGGGTQRMPRLIGPARAKDLIMSGRQIGAAEALAMGLVDKVVEPDEDVMTVALAYAADLAKGAVVAQGLAKSAIDRGLQVDLAESFQVEQEAFVESFRTDDATIGVQSFLANGPGKATFTGR